MNLKYLTITIATAFFCTACANNNAAKNQSPAGYDLSKPQKFTMPEALLEISGIAFKNGNSDTVYTQQDEAGKLFHFKLGNPAIAETRFGKKGDYEDVTICKDTIIMLRSDGTLFSFPLNEVNANEVTNVQEWKDLVPEGEYEGMYADDSTNTLYVLCKQCNNNTGGYKLKINAGTIAALGSFTIDDKMIEQLAGEKKIKFRPAALAKNPITNQWYILSSVNKLLVVADENFIVKETCKLSSTLFSQPEGIAFDKMGNLFISNEGSGADAGNILQFNRKQ